MRSSTKLQEGVIRANKEGRIRLDVDEKQGVPASVGLQDPDAELVASARLFMRFRGMCGAQMNDLNVSQQLY